MDGDRSDPKWAWYWLEADADEADALSPRAAKETPVDPIWVEEVGWREQPEPLPIWDPSDAGVVAAHADLHALFAWLPIRRRRVMQAIYPAPGQRDLSAYRHLRCAQPTLSKIHSAVCGDVLPRMAPVWLAAGKPTPAQVIAKVQYPETLRQYIDLASTARVATAMGIPQHQAWAQVAAMAAVCPMVAALRHRTRHGRRSAQ